MVGFASEETARGSASKSTSDSTLTLLGTTWSALVLTVNTSVYVSIISPIGEAGAGYYCDSLLWYLPVLRLTAVAMLLLALVVVLALLSVGLLLMVVATLVVAALLVLLSLVAILVLAVLALAIALRLLTVALLLLTVAALLAAIRLLAVALLLVVVVAGHVSWVCGYLKIWMWLLEVDVIVEATDCLEDDGRTMVGNVKELMLLMMERMKTARARPRLYICI